MVAMLSRVEVAGSRVEARIAEEAEAAAEGSASETTEESSAAKADLVGEANGLSGRLCSALSWKSPSSLGLVFVSISSLSARETAVAVP